MLGLGALWIISFALGRKGSSQSVTPSVEFVVEEEAAFWVTVNTTRKIFGLDDRSRLLGVTNDSELALEIKREKVPSLLNINKEGECISNVIWCEDRQITFTFWLKGLVWTIPGAQFILLTAHNSSETGFVLSTASNDSVKVSFNGDGMNYVYLVEADVFKEWAFFAAVIDTNARSMKIYINATQLPDSGLVITSDPRDRYGRFTAIGLNLLIPVYYLAGFKIFYKALAHGDLENMYQDVVAGRDSLTNSTLAPEVAEAVTTTALELTSATTLPAEVATVPRTLDDATTTDTAAPAEATTLLVTETSQKPESEQTTVSTPSVGGGLTTPSTSETTTQERKRIDEDITTFFTSASTTREPQPTTAAGRDFLTNSTLATEIAEAVATTALELRSDITLSTTPEKDVNNDVSSTLVSPFLDTSDCVFHERIVKTAHVNWPTSISCENLYISGQRNGSFSWRDSGSCLIADGITNETLYTKNYSKPFFIRGQGYITPDVTRNSSRVYHAYLRVHSSCFYDVITLNQTENTERTCNQSREYAMAIEIKATQGETIALRCPTAQSDSGIYLDNDLHDYTVTWYRNCTAMGTDTEKYGISGGELVMISPDFNDAGSYFSCSYNYKGSEIFTGHFSICMQPSQHYSEPTLQCPSTVLVEEGKSASITCQVDLGFQASRSIFMSMTWQQVGKNDSYSCVSYDEHAAFGWNEGVQCFSNYSAAQEHNKRCFSHTPPKVEQKPMRNIVNYTLKIGNIQASDITSYIAELNDLSKRTNRTIILQRPSRKQETYIYIIIAVGAALALVLFAIIFACLVRRTKKRSRKA